MILNYLIELAVTLLACFLLTAYLRPPLTRVLVDLCRTEDRARFWAAFSNIFLIVLPALFGLGYRPTVSFGVNPFFDVTGQLRWNLLGFLLAVLVIGGAVSFFALIAPRPKEKV